MAVEDAMTVEVETAEPSTPVTDVAKTMAEMEIGSIVVTQNGKAVGIICERDMLDKVVAVNARPGELTAEDIMEKSLISTEPNAEVLDAIRLMVQNDIGHLPVVENGAIVGILTVQDVLKATPRILESLPAPERREKIAEQAPEENICEFCGEVKNSLVEYNGRWICEECRDFLTG
ncbi:hypothetical protein AKJ65_01340 [candidate division MSBL1 archaeon SCGC-AAA259E19]|uniref:Inosine-5-monophosphate dehydrogenase n=1 Tax=candidate division MSBL1 archaeon SCGC-AAA259E19 TaxID=1698264 RepID=A0A133UNC4_9EURY|nr:hypothetical protein AKJ65_01340 [candidate division MSBL1 archaeon SCGC-AAA259E19]